MGSLMGSARTVAYLPVTQTDHDSLSLTVEGQGKPVFSQDTSIINIMELLNASGQFLSSIAGPRHRAQAEEGGGGRGAAQGQAGRARCAEAREGGQEAPGAGRLRAPAAGAHCSPASAHTLPPVALAAVIASDRPTYT